MVAFALCVMIMKVVTAYRIGHVMRSSSSLRCMAAALHSHQNNITARLRYCVGQLCGCLLNVWVKSAVGILMKTKG